MLKVLGHLNWLAIGLGAVSSMVVGFFWYGPLFGKAWMKGIGKTSEQLGKPGPAYILTLFAALIEAAVLGLIAYSVGAQTLGRGVIVGFVVALGFVATTFATQYLFERRTAGLFAINAGYHLVALVVMGAILGLMP